MESDTGERKPGDIPCSEENHQEPQESDEVEQEDKAGAEGTINEQITTEEETQDKQAIQPLHYEKDAAKATSNNPFQPRNFNARRGTGGPIQTSIALQQFNGANKDDEASKDDTVIDMTPTKSEDRKAKKEKDSKTRNVKQIPWLGMFRYADRTDKMMMIVGLVFACIHGVAMPFSLLMYREILNVFINTDVLRVINQKGKQFCDAICGNATEYVANFSCAANTTLTTTSPTMLTNIPAEWWSVFHNENGPSFYATAPEIPDILRRNVSEVLKLVTYNCTTALFTAEGCSKLNSSTFEYSEIASVCIPKAFNTWNDVSPHVFGMLGVGLATFFIAFTHIFFWNFTAERQICRIRKKLFEAILSKDMSWFDLRDGRALNSQLYDETNKMLEGIGDKISTTANITMGFVSAYIMSFSINAELAGVCVSLVPVSLFATIMLTRTLRSFSSKQSVAYAKASSLSVQTLGNVRTVTAFGRQDFEVEKYSSNLHDALMTGIRKSVFTGAAQGSIWFSIACSQALAMWYGLNKFGTSFTAGGDVSIVMFGILACALQFGQAAPNFELIATAKASASEIFSIIDEKPKISNFTKEGKRPQSVSGAIEVENVEFAYPKDPTTKILKGISFSVQPGQTVALVGASGSGKSTIIQMLLRFYDAGTGSIKLDEKDITGLNLGWLRQQIGFVGQEPVLFSRSIAENIRMGKPDATMEEIVDACKLANAHGFITLLPDKYDTFVGDRGAQLSGGQKQRIAIARGIIKNPRILLLDEATSALDTHSERIVQEALDRASAGRTTIVIAHRLSTIKNADLILVLDKGVIVEAGKHADLMAKGEGGAYYALAKTQQLSDQLRSHIEDSEDVVDEDSAEVIHKRVNSQRKRTSTIASKKSVTSVEEGKIGSPAVEEEEEEEENMKPPQAGMVTVLRWNAKEWYLIVLGSIAACVAGLAAPLQSTIISSQLGNFAKQDQVDREESSRYYAVAQLLFGLVLAVSFTIQFTSFGIAGEKLTARLRRKSFSAMLRQDMSWFDRVENQPGSLAATLATETTAIQGASGSRIGMIFNLAANIGTSVIYSLITRWDLTLISYSLLPVIFVCNMINIRLNMGFAKKDSKALKKVGQLTTEAICNMRTVVALGQHPYFLEEFGNTFEELMDKVRRKTALQALTLGFSNGMIFLAWALVFGYGSSLIDRNLIDFVLLFRIYSMATSGSFSASRMAAFVPDMGKAKIAAGKIRDLLALQPKVDWASEDGVKLVQFAGKVEFRDVKFHYPNRPDIKVLRDLTFKVKPGQTVALVGPSGCGKSTCLLLIERFYEPTGGQILIEDIPITNVNVTSLRGKIGMVQQEPALFDASIWENIMYGTVEEEKVNGEVPSKLIHRRTQHSVAFVEELHNGFETTVGDRGNQLSGGQKQRVAIARALARNPRLLLCDEATSALDATNEKLVQTDIDAAREGRTCLIVAHRLATIQHADKILVFNKGRIAEEGRHEELLEKRGLYYTLYMAQALGCSGSS